MLHVSCFMFVLHPKKTQKIDFPKCALPPPPTQLFPDPVLPFLVVSWNSFFFPARNSLSLSVFPFFSRHFRGSVGILVGKCSATRCSVAAPPPGARQGFGGPMHPRHTPAVAERGATGALGGGGV